MHLVCRDCTEVIEADLSVAAPFTAQLRETFGFETDMKHFAIFGRCASAPRGERRAARTAPPGRGPEALRRPS